MARFDKNLFDEALQGAIQAMHLPPLKAAESKGLPTTPLIEKAIAAVRKDPAANKFAAVAEIAWNSVPKECKLP